MKIRKDLFMETENNKGASYPFFAMLDRMQYIHRWGLMRNSKVENNKEHTMDVAVIAHALCVIRNELFMQGREPVDPNAACVAALFHDATEVITGDMPTPIKYENKDITQSYKNLETQSGERLLAMLPSEFKDVYRPLLLPDREDPVQNSVMEVVKAADKISAYIKCITEENAGNREFMVAKKSISRAIRDFDLPEVAYFMEHFIPSYGLTLDQISR